MPNALEGLKVIDLSRLLPGPYCSMVLADLGADVIKIEEPGTGDYSRYQGFKKGGKLRTSFEILNRNKRSMTLNLKTSAGREILKKLCSDADVVLESFRPGVMDRLGVGYETLRALNPKIIYCAITGYGQEGPYRNRPGHDLNYLGYAGIIDMTGPKGGTPSLIGTQVADLAGGALQGVVGILAALRARDRTGKGQFVDVGMMQASFSLNLLHWAEQMDRPGQEIHRGDTNLTGRYACYGVYRCGDGRYVTLGALEAKFWENFCNRVGRPEWIAVHLSEEPPVNEKLKKEVTELFLSKPSAHWLGLLEDEDICFGPVQSVKESGEDPQIAASRMVYTAPNSAGEPLRHPSLGFQLSETPATHQRPAPGLGEHTVAVLTGLGYGKADVDRLRGEGAI